MDELMLATAAAPGCRLLSGIAAVSVRFLPGDTDAQAAVLGLGLPWVKSPGRMAGSDPYVCGCAPQELVCMGLEAAPLSMLLETLAPGRFPSAFAIDMGESLAVFELRGTQLEPWLRHLVDAVVVPIGAGCLSRCSLANVPVLLLRLEMDRLWLVVERPLVPYVSEWLSYAHAGVRVA